jgi:hypothetical protein
MPNRAPHVSDLRRWLAKEPFASTVRCVYPDGDDRSVRVGTSRSRWRDAEEAIGTEWLRLEALTEAGEVLRVFTDGGIEVTSPGESYTPSTPGRSENPLVQLEVLARLISNAHNEGAERHADAYRLAYDQQCALVSVMSERLKQLEVAWHRLLMSMQQQQPEGGELDSNMQMVAALVGSALPGLLPMLTSKGPAPEQTSAPPPPKNGAG